MAARSAPAGWHGGFATGFKTVAALIPSWSALRLSTTAKKAASKLAGGLASSALTPASPISVSAMIRKQVGACSAISRAAAFGLPQPVHASHPGPVL